MARKLTHDEQAARQVADAIQRARFGRVKEGSEDFAILGRLALLFDRAGPCVHFLANEAIDPEFEG